MKTSKRHFGWLIIAATLLVVAPACGDDDDGNGSTSDVGGDTSQDQGGTDQGGTDQGGTDMGGEDTGGEDTGGEDTGGEDTGGEDTGGEDTGGEDTGGDMIGGDMGGDMIGGDMGGDMIGGDMAEDTGGADAGPCGINTSGVSWDEDQDIIIEYVRFHPDSAIRIRNVSGETLTVGDDTWTLSFWPTTQSLPDFTLAAGASLTIHTQGSGTDSATELFLGLSDTAGNRADAADDELALLSAPKSTGPFDETTMEVFVAWGAAPGIGTSSLSDEATTAGFWTSGEFVSGTTSATGILATGDVTGASGYTVLTDDSCF